MAVSRGRSGLRRALAGVLAVALVAALGHLALWLVAVIRLEAEFVAWQTQCRDAGWTVTSDLPSWGGWPFEAALDVPRLSLGGGAAQIPGGFTWQGTGVRLAVTPMQPRVLQIRLGGPQRLRVAALPEVVIQADRLTFMLKLDRSGPAELAASGLRLRTDAGETMVGTLTGQGMAQRATGPDEAALAVSLAAEAVSLPGNWGLGSRIATVSADATLTGPLRPASTAAAYAAAWRDGGGTLQVSRFALGWGPLGLSAGATFRLDAQLQPAGSGTARIVGYGETLDALAAARVVAPRAATAAKAVLGLLATAPEGGGAPRIDVPFELQDRLFSVARFPLARVVEWVWQ
ncbi:conserved protein of unknown function [Rhodovastum atsumiense]|uniref:DUF2125 domain-containing protein n=1 Tax=Rhodovastum atsumiense TaxID=504468 RepID=A0A5M6J0W6_9PROT|nr:DUF2125 domain-containing protein [Rhodovastum atsumiense]KAA5613268.1 DUF2125 domain-containing protein [Rhodovastum atsumiense]CAH2600569.1 conserved protein of unknown function [Rhodovastum atsumiense]